MLKNLWTCRNNLKTNRHTEYNVKKYDFRGNKFETAGHWNDEGAAVWWVGVKI